jgi:hypothetical protein
MEAALPIGLLGRVVECTCVTRLSHTQLCHGFAAKIYQIACQYSSVQENSTRQENAL